MNENETEAYSHTYHEPPEDEPTVSEPSPAELSRANSRRLTEVEAWTENRIDYVEQALADLERAQILNSIAVICIGLAVILQTYVKAKTAE